ncbi:MAG: hypothetical protein COV67_01965 [Nitrospinae bacterium CG11_big_fil_rev_8_21_14_0_20_56_8]|nr:MAG: hypothetical protein COV67_01965 [Nitrospinae bacterium CG11_big_fil_rev_8_21_14_0_20_56_8]
MDIDHRCTKLSELIYDGYTYIFLYFEIAKNAKEINNQKFGKFFGIVQNSALNSAILEICKIYELNDQFKLYSIPALCRFISNQDLTTPPDEFAKDVRKLEIYLGKNRNNLPSLFSDKIIGQIIDKSKDSIRQLKGFDWMRNALKMAKQMRDKHTAHAEIHELMIKGPSIHNMEKLLKWAENFVDVISGNFNEKNVNRDTKGDAKKIECAILRIFEKLEI